MAQSVLRKCARCGRTFYSDGHRRLYCDNCKYAAALERQRVYRERIRQEKAAEKAKETRKKTVVEIDRLAAAEGISYGKYCLKYGI